MKKIAPYSLILFIVILFGTGCGIFNKKSVNWQPVKSKKTSFVHTVKWQKESLSIIAKWYTEDIKNVNRLADVNPNINPECLFIGNNIFIPEDLLKNRAALPENYVISFYKKPEKKTPLHKSVKKPKKMSKVTKKPKPPKEEEEFILFGPK